MSFTKKGLIKAGMTEEEADAVFQATGQFLVQKINRQRKRDLLAEYHKENAGIPRGRRGLIPRTQLQGRYMRQGLEMADFGSTQLQEDLVDQALERLEKIDLQGIRDVVVKQVNRVLDDMSPEGLTHSASMAVREKVGQLIDGGYASTKGDISDTPITMPHIPFPEGEKETPADTQEGQDNG